MRTPEFEKMNYIAEPQWWMTTKNDARLSEFVGETIGVQTWEMLETAVFNEVSMWERLFWQVHFALFPLR